MRDDALDLYMAQMALEASMSRRRRAAYRRLGSVPLVLLGQGIRQRIRDAACRIAVHHGYHCRERFGLKPKPHRHGIRQACPFRPIIKDETDLVPD